MKPREKGKGVNVGQDGAGGVYFQTCPGPGQGMMVLAVPHLCSGEMESSPLRSTFLNVSLPTANSHTIKKKNRKQVKQPSHPTISMPSPSVHGSLGQPRGALLLSPVPQSSRALNGRSCLASLSLGVQITNIFIGIAVMPPNRRPQKYLI